jgi:hypothetical protein
MTSVTQSARLAAAWAVLPVSAQTATLRPMGSTLLRRAAFPATQTQKVR